MTFDSPAIDGLGHAKKQPMLDDSDNLPDLRCQLMRIMDLSTVAIENQIPFVCDEVCHQSRLF